MVVSSIYLLALLATCLAAEPERQPFRPSFDSAKANANRIFNAVNSAGRQWGSSLNHNGFSFIPAVMPAGTLMYHGGVQDTPPEHPEWLAFEMEHAGAFASSWMNGPGQPGRGRGRRPRASLSQKPLSQPPPGDHDDGPGGNIRGYFHTYQTTRDVRLLYVDGMSAGKTNMGTLDSQDYVLRENKTDPRDRFMGETARADAMCDLVTQWGWDGIIRMEIGFEVIYCNFSSGIQLDSAVRTFFFEDKIGDPGMELFMWSRAVAERYDGLGGDRVQMDFSSMVSGFFFPINVSSTDPERPDLIRLGAAPLEELKGIKGYLQDVCTQDRKFTVNWQGVTDMIVSRLSNRFASMASRSISLGHFVNELEGAVLPYFEAPSLPGDINLARTEKNRTAEALERCSKQYLKPALISRERWSEQDELIHAALESVMHSICHSLLYMRSLLQEASPGSSYFITVDDSNKELENAVDISRGILRNLMEELAWPIWRKPQVCPDGELLFVAMWPIGDDEDYYDPGCRSIQQLQGGLRNSYWRR